MLEKNITLSYSPAHQPSSNGIAERMVGMLKTTVRRMLKQAHLGRELVGIWKSRHKAQAKSLDDRGSVGYLLDIDIWQSGTTCIMQDGVVVKGLAPKRPDITSIQAPISMS